MDGQLSWRDFLNAYFRSQADASGFEPKRFFFVAEYLLMDEDKSGHITLDEAMKLLFSRSKGRADEEGDGGDDQGLLGHVDPRRDDDGQCADGTGDVWRLLRQLRRAADARAVVARERGRTRAVTPARARAPTAASAAARR